MLPGFLTHICKIKDLRIFTMLSLVMGTIIFVFGITPGFEVLRNHLKPAEGNCPCPINKKYGGLRHSREHRCVLALVLRTAVQQMIFPSSSEYCHIATSVCMSSTCVFVKEIPSHTYCGYWLLQASRYNSYTGCFARHLAKLVTGENVKVTLDVWRLTVHQTSENRTTRTIADILALGSGHFWLPKSAKHHTERETPMLTWWSLGFTKCICYSFCSNDAQLTMFLCKWDEWSSF